MPSGREPKLHNSARKTEENLYGRLVTLADRQCLPVTDLAMQFVPASAYRSRIVRRRPKPAIGPQEIADASTEVAVKPLLIVILLLFFLSFARTQESQPAPKNRPPAEYKIPPEAAKQVNPVKPTPESLAKAKRTYGIDCAMCHGKDGDGKGDVGADMKLK